MKNILFDDCSAEKFKNSEFKASFSAESTKPETAGKYQFSALS
ncbi:hypothetical protein [Lactiplantibacillus pentosus]|nr:hypothetical protein [Lactiplantibacillus pentosus]UZO89351.1 hypothetical protein HPK28_04370 [Lactiplantibacillus pentosus]